MSFIEVILEIEKSILMGRFSSSFVLLSRKEIKERKNYVGPIITEIPAFTLFYIFSV
jgi:hypothetical protein